MRYIHPVMLVKKLHSFDLVATIEVASTLDFKNHQQRLSEKKSQAQNSRDYMQKAFNRCQVIKAQEDKHYISGVLHENVEVLGGVAFLTREMPDFNRESLDFSIRVDDIDHLMFTEAYKFMLKNGELGDKTKDLTKALLRHSDKIDLINLFRCYSLEMNQAYQRLRNECESLRGEDYEYFKGLLGNIRGHFAENYFETLFRGFLTDFLIIPRLSYRVNRIDPKLGKYRVRESDIDLLVACQREEFYDALYVMGMTKSTKVDCNPETMKLHSGFFPK